MKKILKKLGVIVSTLIFFITRPASIDDLAGSYTKLPGELQKLSIVYGVAAWETEMIRRAYNDTFATKDQSINKAATQLVKILFYKIPESEEIALSKKRYLSDTASEKINKDFLPTIMDYLVYSYLQEEIKNKKITSILDKITPLNLTLSEKKFFNAASPLVRRLTTLSAIWFFKSKIKDFDYEALLKEKLITACDDLIDDSEITDKQKEKINKIKENAELIGQNQKGTKDFEQISDIEKKIITILKEIAQSNKHPEKLSQLMDITITLNNKQTKKFADCFETMLRNLCNIVTYDQETKSFSIKKITVIKESSPLPQLLDFYKKYPTIKEQKKEIAYKEWAKLVSNIPGVLYNQKLPGAKDNNYEIKATFPNLIIITNYLLGLDWFKDSPAEQPIDNATAKTFVAEHLPQFITIFSDNENEDSDEEYDDEDKNSEDEKNEIDYYGKLNINHSNGFSYTIKISDGHGYMRYIKPENPEITTITKPLLEKNHIFWILSTIEQWKENLPPNVFYLFSQQIDESDFIRELPKKFCYLPSQYMRFIKKLIEKKLTNNDQGKANTILKLYSKFIEKGPVTKTKNKKRPISYDKIIAYAIDQLNSNRIKTKKRALKLLRLLVKEGQANQDAITAAKNAFQDESSGVRKGALALFKALIENKQAYNVAKEIAQTTLQGNDSTRKKDAFELFKILIENKQAYDAASKAATITLSGNYFWTQLEALELFIFLVKNKQGYKAASNAATIASQNNNSWVKIKALELFTLLVEKKQAYDAAINAAIIESKNEDSSVQKSVFKLFQSLFSNKKTEAIKKAEKAASHELINKGNNQLFKILIENKQAYEAASNAAKKTLDNVTRSTKNSVNNSRSKIKALELFILLVKNKQAYDAASNAAKITLKDNDINVRKYAKKLEKALKKKRGQA